MGTGVVFLEANPLSALHWRLPASPTTASTPSAPRPPLVTSSTCSYATIHRLTSSNDTLSSIPDPLAALREINSQLLQRYHPQAGRGSLAGIEHVIVYMAGGELTLWQQDNGEWMQVATDCPAQPSSSYESLKLVSHLPMDVECLLMAYLKQIIQLELFIKELTQIKEAIDITLPHIDKISAGEGALISQEIMTQVRDLIEKMLREIYCGQLEKVVHDKMRTIKPLLDRHAALAAKAQLVALDAIVEKWLRDYPINWEATRALIVGPQDPRKGLIEKQYFKTIYREKLSQATGHYVSYVEMLPHQIPEINIKMHLLEGYLASKEANRRIATHVLGDEKALFSDVLRSHAPPVLQSILRKPMQCTVGRGQSLEGTASVGTVSESTYSSGLLL